MDRSVGVADCMYGDGRHRTHRREIRMHEAVRRRQTHAGLLLYSPVLVTEEGEGARSIDVS